MKRSDLTSFIKENIIETLSEADVDVPLTKLTTTKANSKITNAKGFAQFILQTWNNISSEENESVTSLQDLKIAKAKLEKVAKSEETSIAEANVGLDDLQDIGYDDGEYAVNMHFNKDVIGINNELDYKYYRRGFLQGVKDSTASYKLEENTTPIRLNEAKFKVGDKVTMKGGGDEMEVMDSRRMFDSKINAYIVKKSDGKTVEYDESQLKLKENAIPLMKDFTYDYEDIGQFYLEGFGKEHTLNNDQLGKLGKMITNRFYDGDIGKAYDTLVNPHKNPYDIKEDEDDDLDAKAIKQAKGARGKHKKLDIALKSLKSITAEMKSLAREYSKADGVEKEKIKDKLKKKTPIKKELEAMVAKLEKNVI